MVIKYLTYQDNQLKAINPAQEDDFTQYVHISNSRNISAIHTFNPASNSAPFILGNNADGYLVSGLNADQLDGYNSIDFFIKNYTINYTISNPNTWESSSIIIPNTINTIKQYNVYTKMMNITSQLSYSSYSSFAVSNYGSLYQFVGSSFSSNILYTESIVYVVTNENDGHGIRFNLNNSTGNLNLQYSSSASGTVCTSIISNM